MPMGSFVYWRLDKCLLAVIAFINRSDNKINLLHFYRTKMITFRLGEPGVHSEQEWPLDEI